MERNGRSSGGRELIGSKLLGVGRRNEMVEGGWKGE